VQEPPPPLAPQRPGLPAPIEDVVQRALAKEPASRFASAGELAQALEQAWPMASSSAGQPTLADIHSQPTRVYHPPLAAASAAPQPIPSVEPGGSQRSGVPLRARPRPLLSILGPLLVLLLLAGALLASRGGGQGVAATSSPSEAVVQQSAPTPAPPSSVPTETASPPAAGAIAQLQTMVEAGIAAGKAGASGEQLREQLAAAQRATAGGDQREAANQLRQVKDTILTGVGKGEIAPDFAQQMLRAVTSLENSNPTP
jgi:hypothetical protein